MIEEIEDEENKHDTKGNEEVLESNQEFGIIGFQSASN